jgi:carbonic anhydrase/acetyltransferase-like protein (isoleucine patch superfamily)
LNLINIKTKFINLFYFLFSKNINIQKGCIFENDIKLYPCKKSKIILKKNIQIKKFTEIIASNSNVHIQSNTNIKANINIEVNQETIKIGENVTIGNNCEILVENSILEIKSETIVDSNCKIMLKNNSQCIIGTNNYIGQGSVLSAINGNINTCENVKIDKYCILKLSNNEKKVNLSIGSNCHIWAGCYISLGSSKL